MTCRYQWFPGVRNKLYLLVPIRNSSFSFFFAIKKKIYSDPQWTQNIFYSGIKKNIGRLPLYHFSSCLMQYLEINYNILTWYMLNQRQLVPDVFSIRLNDRSIYSAPRICYTSGNCKSDSPDININIHGHLKFVNETEYFLVFMVSVIFFCIPKDANVCSQPNLEGQLYVGLFHPQTAKPRHLFIVNCSNTSHYNL